MIHSAIRRRSRNLAPAIKDTDRCPPTNATVQHEQPWRTYGHHPVPQKIKIKLSKPTREEFLRIRNWAIEKQKVEGRREEIERQRNLVFERQAKELIEASKRTQKTMLLDVIHKQKEAREAMKRERVIAQQRYLAFLRAARSTPLLHEIRRIEFEDAIKQRDRARMELYNTRIKPFRIVRPGEIVKSDILKELGRMLEIELHIPFEVKASRLWMDSQTRCLPSLNGLNTGSNTLSKNEDLGTVQRVETAMQTKGSTLSPRKMAESIKVLQPTIPGSKEGHDERERQKPRFLNEYDQKGPISEQIDSANA